MLNTTQNFPKRNPAYAPLRRAIKVPKGMKVVAVDSSNIECRVNAWVANQYDLLELFRNGGDAYADLAVNFDGRYTAQEIHDGAKAGDKHLKLLRNTAKTIVLGCGYGTSGARAARAMWTAGVRLHKDYDKHEAKAIEYHGIYRAANASIVHFWKTCQRVIEALVLGSHGFFGGPNEDTFEYGILPICGRADWAVPSIRLPSGWCLRYPNLRLDDKGEYVYDRRVGKNMAATRLFGARLDENLVQAFAFQILMSQACDMDADGIEIKGNNHDCWYTVVPEAFAEIVRDKMIRYMKRVPWWAKGLPLDAEGEIGDDFSIC